MCKWSPLLASLVLAIGGTAFADRTIYTVVMCDTNASGVKAQVDTCAKKFEALITAFNQRGITCLRPVRINGDEIGLAEVQRRVAAFPIDGTDTLIFYYVGHGKSREGVHLLDVERGAITRDEIRNVLMRAPRVPPRLTLLLTECCAPESAQRPFVPIPMFGLPLSERVPTRNLLENLLLDHSGLVDVTSCSYGEVARIGDENALFSYVLENLIMAESSAEAYDANGDGFVSWKEFFQKVAAATSEVSRGAQVPFAFSLGTSAREFEPDHYAANFGLHFTIVTLNFRRFAAKLTRDPEPDTPAGRIGLRTGDILFTLDDLPIWGPIDVYGHHLDTKVQFYRNGELLTRWGDLPRETPFPPDVPRELYSQNFVTSFQLIPFGKDYGARITRILAGNSPLKPIGLEPGDMIVRIDGQRIGSATDVANHVLETEVIFIDVRTGLLKGAKVNLP
jgi:hypothetical protein